MTGVIATTELAIALKDHAAPLLVLEHDDPRWAYFSLYNALAQEELAVLAEQDRGDRPDSPDG